MDLKKEQAKALKKARGYIDSGQCYMAQIYVDRANEFWPVSKKTMTTLNNRLKKCRVKQAGGKARGSTRRYSKRGGGSKLDIRNANQLQEYILRAGFKMNPYARSYYEAIVDAERYAHEYGGASPLKGLKVQALYFLTNVKAQGEEQKQAKKDLLAWAKSKEGW